MRNIPVGTKVKIEESDKCSHIPNKTADDCPECTFMKPGPLEGSGICKYPEMQKKEQEEKVSDMKPATTLRELLKPPFHHDGSSTGMVYDDNTRLLDIRGWGFFQYYENGAQLQDEFKEFVVQALNEKWDREKSVSELNTDKE
jgi:hypothetical protein